MRHCLVILGSIALNLIMAPVALKAHKPLPELDPEQSIAQDLYLGFCRNGRRSLESSKIRLLFNRVLRAQVASVISLSILICGTFGAAGCVVPWMNTRGIVVERPPGDNSKFFAKIKVITLQNRLLRRNSQGEISVTPFAYQAEAVVIEGITGARAGEIVRIISQATSCDEPFEQDQIGFIASDDIAEIGDVRRLVLKPWWGHPPEAPFWGRKE